MSLNLFNELNLDTNDALNYKIIIAGLNGGPVTGAIKADFGFGGGNDFETAAEALRDIPIVGAAIAAKNKFSNVANISGKSATTQLETRKVWNNSKMPDLNVTFTLYQSSAENQSIMEKIRRLNSAVYPIKAGQFFKAPLGYRFVGSKALNARGTVSLQIGRWFRALDLVISDLSYTFSKEVNVSGHPIEAEISVTFQPFRALSYEEVSTWFIAG